MTKGSGDFSIGGNLWPGLSKLIEECGEVQDLLPEAVLMEAIGRMQQVSGKLIGSEGRTDHWSGDLNRMLIEELGDLRAAIAFFIEANNIETASVAARQRQKLATFWHWRRETMEKRP